MAARPLLFALVLFAPFCDAVESLRITQLQRCGDLLEEQRLSYCLSVRGIEEGPLEVLLGEQRLASDTVQREGASLRLTLPVNTPSAALHLEQGKRRSNPVWLSSGRSQVLAAGPDEVEKNSDGLTSYRDLVGLLIEEKHEGLAEARRLAEKYQAQVVGAIPPLNFYQLRIPAKNLLERDALILRIGSETSVDAVVVEESAPEKGEEAERNASVRQSGQDEWIANRAADAVHFYRHAEGLLPAGKAPTPLRIGVIERDLDFDAPDFSAYLGACHPQGRTCVYGRDASRADGHGSTVAGILAANWGEGGNSGFLQALDDVGPGFEVIVERNSDAGISANIAASVNLVEDGARILNWSWGIHRIGTRDVEGDEVDSLVRSGIAMSGYEELLEEFFLWLRREHPEVVVINSAGNGAAHSGADEYRLPSSFVTDQLLVVGGHQRNPRSKGSVEDPDYVSRRDSSNLDMRVDVMAAACVRASTAEAGKRGEVHCGTSYATPLVSAVVAAMLSINPQLRPEELRMLLRRSAMTIGGDFEAVDAEDLTAPILPSERAYQLDHPDVGRSARLDMRKALELARQSRDRVR
ncbi:S8/S53 family peptidase [Pseudomonas mangrovi]|uniref:Peptidase S8 and S53 subtilisin kexin sedolisin n=1 Tax=Pseudomonas mangrovi TaxID=2161748 RepID=A0A2T5P9X8_9PSED|nr:peptidase S8 and S53 subtilisin kexin sedolisin [Pseudomonas mangrovi]